MDIMTEAAADQIVDLEMKQDGIVSDEQVREIAQKHGLDPETLVREYHSSIEFMEYYDNVLRPEIKDGLWS